MPPEDHAHLYRLRSLRHAGIGLYGASDAPYGPLNPWIGIRAAHDRRPAAGESLGPDERLTAEQALALYLPDGGIGNGDVADLVVLRPGARIGIDDDPVALTFVGGAPAYRAAANDPPAAEGARV